MSVRVLFVNPSPVRGGAEEMLLALCREFDQARVAAEVASLADGPFPDDLENAGVVVHRLRAGRLRNAVRWAATVRRIASLARTRDVVFSWQVKGHYYGTPAARVAHKASAWWDHGIRPSRGDDRYGIDSVLPRSLRADGVVCSSAAAASAISGAVAIHPGIDVARFATGDRTDARASLGLAPDDLAVGIVGRLQPWKGQHVFLRAAAKIAAAQPRARFVVVGGTPGGFSADYPASLRSLAADLGIADRVVFTGQREDVPAVLSALDVFVHASEAEPFGIAIVEAMAAALPVVATRGGGVAEIVSDGQTGLLVEAGHVSGIADAVARVLGDRALAERIADAGHARAKAHFTTERMIAETTAFIEGLGARR